MSEYNIVLSTDEYTVVSEYVPEVQKSDQYQSEHDLEKEFILLLCGDQEHTGQGYEYLRIRDEKSLILNLRKQLEILNNYQFTDSEWERFFKQSIAPSDEGIVEKSRRIQTDHIQNLKRDDGTTKNIVLIDKKNIHNNRTQVINQYVADEGTYKNRYDVTILVNGLPLVHVELKRRGVPLKEAFNQIDRYQNDSFWSGCGLFEYVQIFVISNGTNTKYYSNTTREGHLKEINESTRRRGRKTSNSFEFTSFWADGKNRIIPDLVDFTKTFFSRHVLLSILTRYCVFTSEDLLLVMRPYQIAATERILNRIEVSTNYKKMGTLEAGGYIWHTTGSGKTLTSFKTAQLASRLGYVDKVLFVVDRKDLDYQTMKEYDRFEKGAANGNNSTAILTRQLGDPNARIIVTTIQKLEIFVKKNKEHEVYNKHVVLIFDECHRSQFGEMHTLITKSFKKYHLFGFTGTPIFTVNSVSGKNPTLRTTQDAFGDRLHTYTIINAINDQNVLPFNIDYVKTLRAADDISDEPVQGIETEGILLSPERVSLVTQYILDHYDQKTFAGTSYKYRGRTVSGFNSIFAVSSIPAAKAYYREFKEQLKSTGRSLRIATIYSYAANGDDQGQEILDAGSLSTEGLDTTDREFLEDAIKDYNLAFNTNFSTDGDSFQNYYKDLSQRMKNREIDILIVVNMFLTGFDATTLNTLWVDKFLQMHGLIQAFSRTNRILNSVKKYGNIVCFRNLRKQVEAAISLFGDQGACSTVLLRPFEDYYHGYEDENGKHVNGYLDQVERLLEEFPISEQIVGETRAKQFIALFGAILRLRNILVAFDKFEGDMTLSERQLQDYKSKYLDIYQELKKPKQKVQITLDVVFEMELVRQDEINIDYILAMVAKYHDKNDRGKEILVDLERAIGSSMNLRSKKELIMKFIRDVDPSGDVELGEDWRRYVEEQKMIDLEDIISRYNLKHDETVRFMEIAFRDANFKTTGTDIDLILPPMSRFSSSRSQNKELIIEELRKYYEQYFGL